MEFEGLVFRILPVVSGSSARGAWKKQDVVFEIPGEFNRKICVTFFGDRAEDAATLKEGDTAEVSVNVESREYNGRWYTDVRAWKMIRKSAEDARAMDDVPFNEDAEPAEPADIDDLPF